MSAAEAARQDKAQNCLMKMASSIRFLLRQGLSFRGVPEDQGNYVQLLNLQGEFDDDVAQWMRKKTNFTSRQCTGEIQDEFAHTVIRSIIEDVKNAGNFSIMVDGTRGVAGKEQECVCLRFVDADYEIHEEMIGLYEVSDTTGVGVAAMIKDVLLRMGLPLEDLRGQTYDGAANMTGAYKGCQAVLTKDNPLALHFKCSAHCVNLALMHALEETSVAYDSIEQVNELGKFYKRSQKYSETFKEVLDNDSDESASRGTSSAHLRPLCPTRWTCRRRALTAVLSRYNEVLESLRILGKTPGEAGSKARNLLKVFEAPTTMLGIEMAHRVALKLEGLNEALQARQYTITDMLKAVTMTKNGLKELRTEEEFSKMVNNVKAKVEACGMSELKAPRPTRPPARYTGQAKAHAPTSVEERYRPEYFAILDRASRELDDRFGTSTSGLRVYQKFEEALQSGEVDDSLEAYPELELDRLKAELKLWKREFPDAGSLREARAELKTMNPANRHLFRQVQVLVRLMLLCPVTSCEAERGFSTLRRVKTWLRSTMGQVRMNSAVICTVHKRRLDSINPADIASRFASRNNQRSLAFGKM